MFSNGLATSTAMWDRQAAHFASARRVLRYDVRGHGASGPTLPHCTLERLADDAAALLDALDIARVDYVGLSLGGMIGQMLAVRHARRVGRLVLCDTTMRSPRAMWVARIAAITAEGLESQVEPSIERWFTPAFRMAHSALVEDMRRMVRATSTNGYLAGATAMRDSPLESVTPGIGQKTLVMVGRDDRSTPLEEAQVLHAAIPGAALAVIDDAAHLPNIEQAAAFNARLAAFLENATA